MFCSLAHISSLSLSAFIYNCADELDGLRFVGAISLWVSAGLCIAGCVILSITVNTQIQATCASFSTGVACASLP
jgi:hypothetical protein